LRDEDPEHFQEAIDFDDEMRGLILKHNHKLTHVPYLHKSCQPLADVDFDSDEDKGQLTWDFSAECEGLCGN